MADLALSKRKSLKIVNPIVVYWTYSSMEFQTFISTRYNPNTFENSLCY